MSFINDHWTVDIKLLGYDKLAKEIRSMILEATPPFAIGIYGRWGSGKTSLMRYVMATLGGAEIKALPLYQDDCFSEISEERRKEIDEIIAEQTDEEKKQIKQIKTIWFNPWQYQHEENPIIALLHEIKTQFSIWLKFQEKAKKITAVTLKSMLSALDMFGDLIPQFKSISGSNIQEAGEKYEQEHFLTPLNSQRFNLFFEQAVKKLLDVDNIKQKEDKKKARLVIFIDDLDRCNEDQIIKLLEAIKLYLSTQYCVFVFGLDQCNVEKALGKKDKKPEESREYLEKLFQGIVRIPISQQYQGFIQKIFKEYFSDITSVGKTPTDKTSLKDKKNNDIVVSSHVIMLSKILESNPRKVKNFLNSLKLHFEVLKEKVKEKRFDIFILVHYLRIYYPDIYTILEHEPDSIKDLQEAINKNLKGRILGNNPRQTFFLKQLSNLLKLDETSVTPETIEELDRISNITSEAYELMQSQISNFKARYAFCEYFNNIIKTNDEEINICHSYLQ